MTEELTYEVTSRFLVQATNCSPDAIDTILEAIDSNKNRSIDESEFLHIAMRVEEVRRHPAEVPEEPIYPSLQKLANHPWRNSLMDGVVVLNLFVLLKQSIMLTRDHISALEYPNLEYVDVFCFTVLYIGEFVVRVLGTGATHYFSSTANIVDFVSTILPAMGHVHRIERHGRHRQLHVLQVGSWQCAWRESPV